MIRTSQASVALDSITSSFSRGVRTVLIPMLRGISMAAGHRPSLWEAAIVLVGAIAVASFVLVPTAGLVVGIGCVAVLSLGTVADALGGKIDGILLLWAGVFPLGYYFLSFPREQSIVTLDRVVMVVAFIGLLLAKPNTRTAVPKGLRQAALAFLLFFVVSCTTLGNLASPLNAARILFDSFLLPLALGWCVIARFDVRGRLPTIHTAVCISSIISAAVAAAEIVTGQDLLPLGTPATAYEGIVRPNGPFESNDSLALIGAVSFFLLLFLRAALGPALSTGRKLLHFVGLAAALGMALMPMFRSIAITMLVVLIMDTFWEQRTSRRAWRVVLMLASAGVIFLLPIVAPRVFEDRSNGQNGYARIAEYQQSLRVFAEHPVLGIGFQNFNRYVAGESRYVASYNGVYSVDWPHSNLAQVLTETGLLGFVPYMMASVLLFRHMWQWRHSSSSAYLAWKYFVYIFLSYWITGLTEGSGYSPLNLWCVFVIAVSCKYVLTEPDLVPSEEVLASNVAFNVPSQVF
jgi:O-antigen ligase